MIALPFSLVMAWADWMGGRSGSKRYTSIYDPYPTTSSRSNALYFLTIPLALLWHGIRFFLPSAITIFVIVWPIRFTYLMLKIHFESYSTTQAIITRVENDRRERFDYMGEREFFKDIWLPYLRLSKRLARSYDQAPWTFVDLREHPFRYHYLVKLLALDAVLWGLTAGIAVGLIAVFLHSVSAWKSYSS